MTGAQIQLFVDRSGTGYNWRLLAANNRETGRGTSLHRDERTCRDEVARLQAAAERLVPRTRREPLGRWTWDLSLDGAVVLSATGSFDRMIRCEQALAGVAARFGAAAIGAVLVNSGSRRRELNLMSPRLGACV